MFFAKERDGHRLVHLASRCSAFRPHFVHSLLYGPQDLVFKPRPDLLFFQRYVLTAFILLIYIYVEYNNWIKNVSKKQISLSFFDKRTSEAKWGCRDSSGPNHYEVELEILWIAWLVSKYFVFDLSSNIHMPFISPLADSEWLNTDIHVFPQ